MKRVSFALILVLLSFGLSYGLTIDAVATGAAVYAGGTALNINVPFDIEIVANVQTGDEDLLGWSTPFLFYGTGDVTTLTTGPGTFVFDWVGAFASHWNAGMFVGEESWDGDLTNSETGGKTGDQYNWTGVSNPGAPFGYVQLGTGVSTVITFEFDGIVGTPTTVGTFCVDSGDFINDTYDWLMDPAIPFGPICWDVAEQPNAPPEFTNCPTSSIVGQWNGAFSYDLDAIDPDGDPITGYEMVSGPGAVDGNGVWSWQPDCGDVGSHTVVVCVTDQFHQCPTGEECTITVQVNNTAPVIAGDDCGNSADPLIVGTTSSKNSQFTATDINGGLLTWSAEAILPAPDAGGSFGIDQNGLFTFSPTQADDGGVFCFTITVTDCNQESDECVVCFQVLGQLKFDIVIEKVHLALSGHHSLVNVYKMQGTEEMWGFDFLIGYDNSALTFISAAQGIDIPDWEYFTYRYNWNGNCGNGCPSGLLRVIAIADENNGVQIPAGAVDVVDGSILFTLDFLVTNNYLYQGMYIPINWYWMGCGDNTIAFHYKSALDPLEIRTAMSKVPTGGSYWYNGWDPMFPWFDVTDPYFGFPTWYGAQMECFCDPPDYDSIKCPVPFIDFYCGGIDIIPVILLDDRGDINLNGVANEIADAVVFTNYFIYGPAAFTINFEGQKAATEINGDGIALTVADLVYLIRVIVGDALALPPMKPVPTTLHVTSGEVTVDAAVGALYATFAGDVEVTLAEGANGMELQTNYRDGQTHAILFSLNEGVTANGHILNSTGQIVSVEAATYEGASFKEITIMPSSFAVNNYPNPFNPTATVEMSLPVASDWTITVFNVVGQRVADFNGHSDAGVVKVQWDASDEASGIYFYKVDAGQYSVTKKMVLLK